MTLILGLMLLTYMGNLPQQLSNSNLGRVEGVVVDADNKPIRGAYVYATSQSSPGRPHTVLTDAQGAFVLDDVLPGHIVMHAYKEADMYPQPSSKFVAPEGVIAPQFELKAGEVFKGIVIRLDKKAGFLQLRVLDAATNELIKGIMFEICRGDHPDDRGYCIWGSVRGDYHLFVPAAVPISIKVSAPDHSEWVYQDQATKSPFTALAAGEERTLTINLQAAGSK